MKQSIQHILDTVPTTPCEAAFVEFAVQVTPPSDDHGNYLSQGDAFWTRPKLHILLLLVLWLRPLHDHLTRPPSLAPIVFGPCSVEAMHPPDSWSRCSLRLFCQLSYSLLYKSLLVFAQDQVAARVCPRGQDRQRC